MAPLHHPDLCCHNCVPVVLQPLFVLYSSYTAPITFVWLLCFYPSTTTSSLLLTHPFIPSSPCLKLTAVALLLCSCLSIPTLEHVFPLLLISPHILSYFIVLQLPVPLYHHLHTSPVSWLPHHHYTFTAFLLFYIIMLCHHHFTSSYYVIIILHRVILHYHIIYHFISLYFISDFILCHHYFMSFHVTIFLSPSFYIITLRCHHLIHLNE